MAYTPEKLAARLTSEGQKTGAFFKNLPADAWDKPLYADGEHWKVRQVLAHLAQVEGGILRLMQSIRTGSQGTPEDFDLDSYNERKVSEVGAASVDAMLGAFQEARARTVAWVTGLDSDDLARTGRHPFLGVAPLEDIIKLMYRHTQLHQRDIRRFVYAGD